MTANAPRDEQEPKVRRWDDQRWLLDNVIKAHGVDWDQPRSLYLNAPCGPEANADFALLRAKVKSFDDIGPAFEATARRREAKANEALAAGYKITARDNFFMAAINWGAAMWPHHAVTKKMREANTRKRVCYTHYAQLADHRIEEAWIPYQGKSLPAWLHLPPGYSGGRIPVVISMPGLDTFKEVFVSLNGDRWLMRGVAVLAVEGPGQAEARILGYHGSVPNFIAAGQAIVDWLVQRPEIDPSRIGIFGNSLGSFTTTLITANESRIRACASASTCLEPGFYTMRAMAPPTYKRRLMLLTGYTDEDAFDAFAQTLTWEGHAERIKVPYLSLAGEIEELSPLSWAETMFGRMTCPRRLVIYQESRHAVGYVPAANLGPYPATLIADWMVDRLSGVPMKSERWFVRSNGEIEKTAL